MAKVPALILLIALFLSGTAQAADLELGSRGPRVAAVQRWLGLNVDRVYGPRDQARRAALAAAPAHARRRHRRPAHLGAR